jgi:DNA-nicking Smr family endonuclease
MHETPAVWAWLAQHEHVMSFHVTPTSASSSWIVG